VKRVASANDSIVVLEDEEKNNSSAKEVGKVFCSVVPFRSIISHLVHEESRGRKHRVVSDVKITRFGPRSRERERDRSVCACVSNEEGKEGK